MEASPITSWQIDGDKMETVTDFIFLHSKITVYGDCSHEIKTCLFLGLIPDHYVVSFIISCNILYFKVYFVWYENCYSSFLLLPICMESIFPSSHFQSICVLRSEVDRQHIYGSWFCIHLASLCLVVGASNSFSLSGKWLWVPAAWGWLGGLNELMHMYVLVTAPGVQPVLCTYCSSLWSSAPIFSHVLSAPGLSCGLQDLLVAACEI